MKRIFVRLDHCTGCHTCELACAVEHSVSKELVAASMEADRPKKRLFVEYVPDQPVPIVCRHCEDAPCLNACISGALWRDDRGAVRRKEEKCIGCWTCIMVCPYGVIGRQERGGNWLAAKCDLCDERESPACVDSCPTNALVFSEADEFASTRRRQVEAALAPPGGR
ncbi:MAG: 4Fe-4S dicluster domain-containing protein [Dehalococcoidia bacterium]